MSEKKLKLPKVYEITDRTPEQYKKHKGKPKLSYSAISSFLEDGYRGEFFQTYFLGKRSEGNIFTAYGSLVGAYMELGVDESKELSNFDISVLDKFGRTKNALYEAEIVIDRGSYCIQGFIDEQVEVKPKLLTIKDFKTGAIDKKEAFYASQEYQQTTLYSHQRVLEGFGIDYSGVVLFDRKGNGQEKYPLRLTGEILNIPTPYSTERAEKVLAKFDEVALEIERYFRIFNKYLK